MANIKLRSGKGSPLTNAEIDANFTNLNTDKLEKSGETASFADLTLQSVSSTLHRSPNAITALFVYDTSKDSDAGAWTEKCQHTSWYQETIYGKWLGSQTSESAARAVSGATTDDYYQLTTDGKFYKLNATSGVTEVFRGNKRSFPKLAAIVAEATSVTIYDLTEAGRPMLCRFIATATATITSKYLLSGANALAAINGKIYVGGTGTNLTGLTTIDFAADKSTLRLTSGYTWNGNLSTRNTVGGYTTVDAAVGAIVNATANAVAVTVLPDAPLDPATGLKVPTIAVATGGGISIIQNTGTVRNSASTSAFTQVTLTPQLLSAGRADAVWYYAANPGSLGASFTLTTKAASTATDFNVGNTTRLMAKDRANYARTSGAVVQLLRNNEGTIGKGIAAKLSDTYNTGWLAGDIRRAYLSAVSAGSVTGPELVTNGTFDTDASGWTISQNSAWVSGALRIESNGSPDPNASSAAITVIPGRVYKITAAVYGSDSVHRILFVRLSTNGAPSGALTPSTGSPNITVGPGSSPTLQSTFVAPAGASVLYVSAQLSVAAGNSGAKIDVNSISVKEVIPNRSYKDAASNIYGTLTSTAVNTGNDLVAYSGFNATDYIQEPYSADLDFGTGEWSVSAWVNNASLPIGGNLLTYTENFSAGAWNGELLTYPSLTEISPIGTNTATQLRETTYSGWHRLSQTTVSTTNCCFSVYVKSDGRNRISLRQGTGYIITFDLSTVTVVSANGGSGQISGTSGGWIRCVAFFPSGMNGVCQIFLNQDHTTDLDSYAGDSSKGVILWGAQLTNSPVLTDYLAVTGTSRVYAFGTLVDRAYSTGPKIDIGVDYVGRLTATAYDGTTTRTVTSSAAYNKATWLKAEAVYKTDGSLAIFVNGQEVAVTRGNPLLTMNSKYNLLTYTEAWATSPWGSQYYSVVANNAGTDPLGGNTASKVTFTSNYSNVGQSVATVSGASYTFSFWAKWLSGNTSLKIRHYRSATGNNTSFTPTSAWQKFTVTVLGVSGGGNVDFGVEDMNSSGFGEILVWGAQVELGSNATTYQRVSAATDFDFQAPLTIGNNYALDAPFPGSIALLKFSATVPTAEQALFMYEQEKHLFAAGAKCVLPASTSVLDLAYDDATDTWSTLQATHEASWSGLVRTSTQVPTAGSFSRTAESSGVQLLARTTTNPGVDVQIPVKNLRPKDMPKDSNQDIVVFDFDAVTSQTDFVLPVGYTARVVYSAGSQKRIGSTKDYTVLFDGFRETVRFGTAPGNGVWVQIHAAKEVA